MKNGLEKLLDCSFLIRKGLTYTLLGSALTFGCGSDPHVNSDSGQKCTGRCDRVVSICDNLDGGYTDASYVPDSGEADSGGYDGVTIYLETRNNATNQPQTTFDHGEDIKFYTRAIDTKCAEYDSCNNPNGQNTQGIKYCIFTDSDGNSATLSIDTNGENINRASYPLGSHIANINCIVRRDNSNVQPKVPISFNVK